MKTELTIEELEEKIKKVELDIQNQTSEKGRVALQMYVEYLQDELKESRARNKKTS